MIKEKVIRKLSDGLVFFILILFIIVLFCVFDFKERLNFLYDNLWMMFVFPLIAAWVIFTKNRLIDYFKQNITNHINIKTDKDT
ncbi:hypothetical protein L3V86_03465 [Thiotrichales bacterium 19S11-10]|nr:hypothetical protein [Thiotrichales bacterium 19S11-10]MCF6806916.1 hypothetical protein [Thiotrichales bacterium 19S9-11]MCF6810885.1 hypothetical protein [Thiotrichales bacterium 19S9-12]